MIIRSLIPDALFASIGPAAGFIGYSLTSKKSKGTLLPALVAGLATVAGGFLAGYLQQKVTGVSGLSMERVGGLVAERVGALPSVYVRERAMTDYGMQRRYMPGRQAPSPGMASPYLRPGAQSARIAALQMEALRGCSSCY